MTTAQEPDVSQGTSWQIPVIAREDGTIGAVEAVVDKDHTSDFFTGDALSQKGQRRYVEWIVRCGRRFAQICRM